MSKVGVRCWSCGLMQRVKEDRVDSTRCNRCNRLFGVGELIVSTVELPRKEEEVDTLDRD